MKQNKKPTVEYLLRGYIGEAINPKDYREESKGKPNEYFRGRSRIRKYSKKPGIYYKNPSKILEDARELCKKENLNTLPSSSQLTREGNPLGGAINRFYPGGIKALREVLGEDNSRKSSGYWRKWENVKNELTKITNRLGHFPTSQEIEKLEEHSLLSAVFNYHNGINEVAKKLKHSPHMVDRGYWRKWENVKNELTKITNRLGHFPSARELKKVQPSNFSAIYRYHKGYKNVKMKMRIKETIKASGYWKIEENVLKEAEKILEREGLDRLPAAKTLAKRKYYSFIGAINKYYGGFSVFREKLAERLGRSSEDKQLSSLLERYAEGGKHD